MNDYNIQVVTGEILQAGTFNKIYIKLIGTECNSGQQRLKAPTGFWPGSKLSFTVSCTANLGTLLLVELESKARMIGLNEWFCAEVMVTTPKGEELLFPCHRWLGSEKVVLRDAVATLRHKETSPELLAHRQESLKVRRQLFKWSIYADGIPHTVHAEFPCNLPPEVRFSFTKDKEFVFSSAVAFMKINLRCPLKFSWSSLRELDTLVCRKTDILEYVQKNWKRDEFFGYQFLNGLNPMMIKRCSKLPDNFPVTSDMVSSFLPMGSTLEQEMEKGNVFLCDYERLRGLDGNLICKKQQYLAAPLCLLFSTPQETLVPIAIQLFQEAGPENPIFLPSDSEHDWLLAKMFVRNAEFNEHELNFHLLRTHLLAEIFTVATMRDLPAAHPLFKLLLPHTRFTLQINIMARKTLISSYGYFPKFTAIGNDSMMEFLQRAVLSLTYSSLCLPDDIKERGLEKIPNFYYRDDGLELWKIIFKFVNGILSYYYTDSDVQTDIELQAWLTSIFQSGFLENPHAGMIFFLDFFPLSPKFSFLSKTSPSVHPPIPPSGFPKSFSTVEELVKFVTMVIFTVSAQHAAVNNGQVRKCFLVFFRFLCLNVILTLPDLTTPPGFQFDYGGWMPNFPSSLQQAPPRRKGLATEHTVSDTLPSISSTVNTMAIVYLLCHDTCDRYALGNYPEVHFSEEIPQKQIQQFQTDLLQFEKKIETRNKTLELPYTYMSPQNMNNSITI
ncbi:hypothetical protein P4O66_019910 [Electrophorus voltai]|uniref:Uncharacterized protein n=1 Tax=Electrophorus voltai TaxID=2609070 RepID=A0AAD8ZUG9_9TELE|nr:hypothetical protein P4O66_019910 [Electrophorus voltai]